MGILQFDDRELIRPAGMDDGVWPLVAALNGTRYVRTIQSCQGHPDRRDEPYVLFRSDELVAQAIDSLALVLAAAKRAGDRTRHQWEVRGQFWTVASGRILVWRLQPMGLPVRWRSGPVLSDLAKLARLFPPFIRTVGAAEAPPALRGLADHYGVPPDADWLPPPLPHPSPSK